VARRGAGAAPEALAEAVLGEELGFASVWLEEHHSIRNHYWSSPWMALAGIAIFLLQFGYFAFFEAIWNVWNWDDVARRYAAVKGVDLGLAGAVSAG